MQDIYKSSEHIPRASYTGVAPVQFVLCHLGLAATVTILTLWKAIVVGLLCTAGRTQYVVPCRRKQSQCFFSISTSMWYLAKHPATSAWNGQHMVPSAYLHYWHFLINANLPVWPLWDPGWENPWSSPNNAESWDCALCSLSSCVGLTHHDTTHREYSF